MTITNDRFMRTMANPFASTLPVLRDNNLTEHAVPAMKDSADALVRAGDAMVTAAARVSTPIVGAYGLGLNAWNKGGAAAGMAPLAGLAGFIGGSLVGSVGIVFNVAQSAFYCVASAAELGSAGLRSLEVAPAQTSDVE